MLCCAVLWMDGRGRDEKKVQWRTDRQEGEGVDRWERLERPGKNARFPFKIDVA